MGAIQEMPPEAGSWQVEIRRESFYLHRGEADDLGAYPGIGFSCPEHALPSLVASLKLVAGTRAYQENQRRPSGSCAITLDSGRACLHIPVITYGAHREGQWQRASVVEIRYGEVPTLLERLESLLDGTYGRGVRGL
ncbi:hypothetical protein SAMN05421810_101103 [Amycolatopsis arida]|uniref:Uncharacterized protein n=1 Tax=Amycolatopsis arida TaxID=587909 RepID=A0A1I5KDY0_9PSEU|nr:hypothetical protein [Amycolatopsis arida]TDX96999.1 hypothetical protein CLV69_102101 [Amycolatopsis arida]SFO83177.1 hypothetical protein SAMN05421810_101103 [Amycolatopsis arida]